jgi:Putative beta-barrel porin 2
MTDYRCRTLKLVPLILFAILFFITSTVFAQGNIKLGRIKVLPEISLRGEYNDNIFLESASEQDDFLSHIVPGINLSYDGSTSDDFFRVGYTADMALYSDYNENNYTAHNAYVSGGIKIPSGFYFQAGDYYVKTEDPYGSATNYNIGTQTERWNNTADILAGCEFGGQFAVESFYKNYLERYDKSEDEWQNRIDHVYGISLLFVITPKTAVFGQYRLTDAAYDEQEDGIDMTEFGGTGVWHSDNSQNYRLGDYFVGIRFKPGGKISGEAKIGWGVKAFDNDTDKDNNPYEDEATFISETVVTYQATEKTQFSLNVQRSIKGSPDSDASSYIDTMAGIRWHQILVHRLSFDIGAQWVNNDYQNEFSGRVDKAYNTYTLDAGADYKIRDWLTAGVGYTYENKTAGNDDYESGEYENNVVYFKISAAY